MMMEDLLPALNDPNPAAAFSVLETKVQSLRECLRKWRCESRLDTDIYNPTTKELLRSLTIFKTLEVPLFIDDFGRKRLMSHYTDLAQNCRVVRDLANKCKDLAKKCNSRYEVTFSSLKGKQVPVKRTENRDFSGLMIGIGSTPFWVDAKKFDIVFEAIPIDLVTPIVHVTHTMQKDLIVAGQKLDPSDNKNSVKGIWFSPKYQLCNPEGEMKSVYGNWAFETTLSKLGVAGIRQGEIVSYKKEVNFILYGSDTVPQDPVMKKATDDAVQLSKDNIDAYTAVSIFVPSRFLPQQGAAFSQAFEQPYEVSHGGFCVKAKRSGTPCNELHA